MEKASKKIPSFSPEINIHSKKILSKLASEQDSIQGLSEIGFSSSRTTKSTSRANGDTTLRNDEVSFGMGEKLGNNPLERMILDTKIVKLKDKIKKKYKGKTVSNLIDEDEFNDDIKQLTELLEVKRNLGL